MSFTLICSHFSVAIKALLEEILTEIPRVSPRKKIKLNEIKRRFIPAQQEAGRAQGNKSISRIANTVPWTGDKSLAGNKRGGDQ